MLPPLTGVPHRINPHPPEVEQHLARLITPLVRARVLTLADWREPEQVPSGLLREGWNRHVRSATRGAPSGMNIHLALQPWSMMLEDATEELRAQDEAKIAITVDAGICAIAALDTVQHHWGETAARVVATALRRGLGRVINVWDPDDIEWVAEWWQDSLEMYCDEEDAEDRKFEKERIQAFAATQQSVRASYLDLSARLDLSAALKALPAGRIRRSAAALLSEARRPRPLWPSRAWQRMKTGEEGYETAAVLLTRTGDDAVRHAYDEMQEQSMNAGYSSPEHGVLLLDTSSPTRLAATLRQLQRLLRTLAWGEHLVHGILDLDDPS